MSSLNVDKLNVSVGIELPSYTASNRPTGTVGLMIFNSTSGTVEIYDCLLYTSPSPRDEL